jgi:hypothetical protein
LARPHPFVETDTLSDGYSGRFYTSGTFCH